MYYMERITHIWPRGTQIADTRLPRARGRRDRNSVAGSQQDARAVAAACVLLQPDVDHLGGCLLSIAGHDDYRRSSDVAYFFEREFLLHFSVIQIVVLLKTP